MTTLRMIRRHIWTPLGTGSLAAIVTAVLMAGISFPGSEGSAAAGENLSKHGTSDSLVYLPPCLPSGQVLSSDAGEPGAVELAVANDGGGETGDAAPAPAESNPPSNTSKPQSYIAARSQLQSSPATNGPAPEAHEPSNSPQQQQASASQAEPVEEASGAVEAAQDDASTGDASASEPEEAALEGPISAASTDDDYEAASGASEEAAGEDEPKTRSAYDLMTGGDPGDSAFRDPLYFNDPDAPHRSILKPGHTFEPKKPDDNGAVDPEKPNGEGPNGEDPNGEPPAGPGQLIVQLATNTVEVIQISGDGGTNIAEIIQENIQVAFNIQLASMDDLPENLELYLANLIASSGIFNGQVLGVEVNSAGGGGLQSIIQDGLNSIVVVQYAGDDGTNIVIIYQLNIQVAVNIQGRKRRCVRRRACPAGPHRCSNPAHGHDSEAQRSLLWQL